jgi:CheY-like chemotaxis protein
MVLNDTQEILELFQDILTGEGYSVSLHAYSTRDLDDVKRVRPTLIISDHPPTREDQGWQFLQKLKMSRETEHIPLLVCTTNTKLVRDNEGWLLSKGVVVIPKPFNIDELLSAVEQMIGKADEPDLGPMASPGTIGQQAPAEAEN